MKALLCALLGTVACAVADYDPLAVGRKPAVADREFTHRQRTVPVRVFTPAGGGAAPVILFSHGLGGSREGSNFLGRHWSACGYVTVFLQHPGSDAAVWRDAAPATGNSTAMTPTAPATSSSNANSKTPQCPPFVIFNLAEDPAGKNDVIDEHPEIAEKLKTQLAHIIESGRSR